MKCDLQCSNIFLITFKTLTLLLGLASTFITIKLCSGHLKHFTNPLF
jgi:hypothetical protein